ncbi:MAG: PASTA domain-containing protein [Bacteroidetes bacterium]|nr:PASTA domain-containing protein [Bacteroidota bacterium]MBS1740616.1 PASTA domain-containing protein [Bacteroidota bacterium]
MLILCGVLYFLFFASLGIITQHGQESKVPNLVGKNLKEARAVLEKLGFEVDVDSSYEPDKKPFVILAQMPDVNATVKVGRSIFLTVNKAEPPMTPMPKLTDLSYRSAVLILNSSRLVLGDTLHRPDFAKGTVLDMLFKGKPIKAGDMVPQGSKIDLVIGEGFGNVESNVPDVIGMSADEGIAILNGNGLTVTTIWDGAIVDSASAIIYNQTPSPFNELDVPNRIKEGDVIDIRIKQDPTSDEMENNRRPANNVNPPATPPTP